MLSGLTQTFDLKQTDMQLWLYFPFWYIYWDSYTMSIIYMSGREGPLNFVDVVKHEKEENSGGQSSKDDESESQVRA